MSVRRSPDSVFASADIAADSARGWPTTQTQEGFS